MCSECWVKVSVFADNGRGIVDSCLFNINTTTGYGIDKVHAYITGHRRCSFSFGGVSDRFLSDIENHFMEALENYEQEFHQSQEDASYPHDVILAFRLAERMLADSQDDSAEEFSNLPRDVRLPVPKDTLIEIARKGGKRSGEVRRAKALPKHQDILRRYDSMNCHKRNRAALLAKETGISEQYIRNIIKKRN